MRFSGAPVDMKTVMLPSSMRNPLPFKPHTILNTKVRPDRLQRQAYPDTQTQEKEEEMQLEGISSQYCDDFVCTSSPLVSSPLSPLESSVTSVDRTCISRVYCHRVEFEQKL